MGDFCVAHNQLVVFFYFKKLKVYFDHFEKKIFGKVSKNEPREPGEPAPFLGGGVLMEKVLGGGKLFYKLVTWWKNFLGGGVVV